jgi:hypothetical protein
MHIVIRVFFRMFRVRGIVRTVPRRAVSLASLWRRWGRKQVVPAEEKPLEQIQEFVRDKILEDPEIKLYLLQIDMIFAEKNVDPRLLRQASEESVYDLILDDRIEALMMKIKERGIEMTSPEEWAMMNNVVQKSKINIMDMYLEAEAEALREQAEEQQQQQQQEQPRSTSSSSPQQQEQPVQ